MIRYAKPRTVDEALAFLAEARWQVLAGGTDFYPALGDKPLTENILDINGIDDLRGVGESDAGLVIGARTTWTDIVSADLPPALDALRQAAREIGSVQIQNQATIAGNLCNASPAADAVPALLVLDAEVELRAVDAVRVLPLGDFILGNRRTARRPDELVTAIRIPAPSLCGATAFRKLGARRYLVISIAMAAARISLGSDGTVNGAAIAIGACSEVARRLPLLEAALIGQPATDGLAALVDAAGLDGLTPIEDVRATVAYRRSAACEIIRRATLAAAGVLGDVAVAA